MHVCIYTQANMKIAYACPVPMKTEIVLVILFVLFRPPYLRCSFMSVLPWSGTVGLRPSRLILVGLDQSWSVLVSLGTFAVLDWSQTVCRSRSVRSVSDGPSRPRSVSISLSRSLPIGLRRSWSASVRFRFLLVSVGLSHRQWLNPYDRQPSHRPD